MLNASYRISGCTSDAVNSFGLLLSTPGTNPAARPWSIHPAAADGGRVSPPRGGALRGAAEASRC